MLSEIHSPFLLHLEYAFQTENDLYLVVPYMPGQAT